MKWVLALVCLAACKEPGTISIDLTLPCPAADQIETVRLQVVKGGTCTACTACGCPCDNTSSTECITGLACQEHPWCTLGDAQAHGIEFDPPSAGSYAVSYHFYAAGDVQVGFLCADVVVESDGTTSSTATTTPGCCLSP